jgi:signal transduction histidine kinase
LPKVFFDEEKIRHVIFNFIDNAIKYSDLGAVKVFAVEEGEGVSVRVKDNGIGFDKIDEANFFQKFYRGNNVRGVNVNGTGLGLFVCAKFGFWIPLHNA